MACEYGNGVAQVLQCYGRVNDKTLCAAYPEIRVEEDYVLLLARHWSIVVQTYWNLEGDRAVVY